LVYGAAEHRVGHGTGDLRQRSQDEQALVHPRVRDDQGGCVDDLVIEQQQVEIDGPRPPPLTSLPAKGPFHVLHQRQQ
jgi:hypothetical protein